MHKYIQCVCICIYELFFLIFKIIVFIKMMGNDDVKHIKENDDVEYNKPETHKNFWKSFGLDNKAGKLLYNLYGESCKINPGLIGSKKTVKKKKEEDEKNQNEEENIPKYKISYPVFKKKIEKEYEVDKIPHRKPLSKILEETKNYEALKDLPIYIGKNKNEEKKKLNEAFLEQKCMVVPPRCAPVVLTEEERKIIIKEARNQFSELGNTNTKEEKIIDSLKNHKSELTTELNQKINQYKSIILNEQKKNNACKNIGNEKLEHVKIQLQNEIDQCRMNIKKVNDVLNSV
ncbi:conserved Plasmodium protein, unknown function [Plasmodium berghei]|uniref:Enkurin domain-containing protein n=2 Tax=Plasmodium berghei TaxID=5821 RepID=A0A509AQG7_PLABA|nr:conserved Plasmodium protein, unknown function [Plasmodium berghei ANKA]CXI99904.1 conserved Plasmodium protein, unknown function [Plasmodium berghei]SCL97929.1 conserved Plasmodium protein, unknown function [Plasmodium berghei]SCM16715.1 conserved Plasmodium protein, unknown function [Plasmodium berghei]VUC57829.1 conserved Plasmodium protein, unknown function [Plasmodium berghei ANKA]|eukprot:XP_034423599.1 conserved Plasmodium protein, unknown function [Plasmodium berghei ANKA]